MPVSNGWRFIFCTWPSAEPIFCQLFYFPLILLSEHYFDKGIRNTQKAEKSINKLSTFVFSSLEHCAKYCTLHTAASGNRAGTACSAFSTQITSSVITRIYLYF